jgi:hypothetical protein
MKRSRFTEEQVGPHQKKFSKPSFEENYMAEDNNPLSSDAIENFSDN